jgi:tetrahydromethanopterin S-methyltransferase subunit G
MADEFVRKEHFDEHVLRMDERFLGLEKRMEQGFAHAEKAREQNLVHVNQRFDGINQRFDSLERRMEEGFSELRADMRQMRNWLVWLFGLVVFGFIGSIVLILLRDMIFK